MWTGAACIYGWHSDDEVILLLYNGIFGLESVLDAPIAIR